MNADPLLRGGFLPGVETLPGLGPDESTTPRAVITTLTHLTGADACLAFHRVPLRLRLIHILPGVELKLKRPQGLQAEPSSSASHCSDLPPASL